ncbi:hypothetical protein N789_00440 [Arenimonas oryziterrae DSM 21050 = YC6267]|uniref:Chemotaxis protein CheY n=2 Tax=Arenimonas TaxID=490567 RepID=A0A091AZ06_9GAMM|nr:hypothetical protein N789_00440 [Arenimonas oryziterrae DSM 21050 = YC6267]
MLRHLVEDISPEIKVTDFPDPVQALLYSQKEPPDLVILDYRMPKMDGLEFARRFRRPLSQRDVPIILVTVVGDEPIRQAALEAGVIDFLVKPVRPRELRLRCKNLLELRQRQQSLKSRAHLLEHQLLSGIHEMEHRERDLLTRLAKATGQREGNDVHHVERISRYSGLIAESAGLDDDNIRLIEYAAPLHDIGNISIPDAILQKPGPLDDDERKRMQTHTLIGHEMLRDSHSDFIQVGAEIALAHHERWDGSGYPNGLIGEAIPMSARIVAVADVLDAMTSNRPYRPAKTIEEALASLKASSGRHFDPDLIRILDGRSNEVAAIHRTFTAAPVA